MFNKITIIFTIAVAATNVKATHTAPAKGTSIANTKLVKSIAKNVVAKAKAKANSVKAVVKKTAKPSNNFGDLSFLTNENAYKAAEAARKKFVMEHIRLAAKRRHETLKYFKAHAHAAWTKKVMK